MLSVQDERLIFSRLGRWRLQSVARDLFPDDRISACCRKRFGGFVSVKLAPSGVCHYGGLETCSSVWVCPICSAKISERRREEVEIAVQGWLAIDGYTCLLSLTVPHSIDQTLSEVLEGYQSSRRKLLNRKTWKSLASDFDLRGSIRSLEATYGVNGWHLHSHEVLFLGRECDTVNLASRVLTLWQSACQAGYGRIPNGHGVDVQGADDLDEYLAAMAPTIETAEAGLADNPGQLNKKHARALGNDLLAGGSRWGIAHEVTKAHLKKSRKAASDTPWDLLRRAADGAAWAGALFVEWGSTMKGRKHLLWSRGLRGLLGIEPEKSDEEIAKENEPGSVLLGLITPAQWNRICSQELRGEILAVAQRGGWAAVERLIIALCKPGGLRPDAECM